MNYQLKEYVRNVYLLETSLYRQLNVYNQVAEDYNYLKSYRGEELRICTARKPEIDWSVLGGLVLGGIIVGGIVGLVIGIIFFYRSYTGFLWTIKISLGAGILLPLFLFIWISIDDQKEYEEKVKAIELENENIKNQNARTKAIAARRAEALEKELDSLGMLYDKTSAILEQYYEKNIIFPKYRNLVAVSSFYEYLSSGRCTQLEGHEGAYNIYESEIRQNMIICKLDEVIEHLENIEDNQYMLYRAIQEGNNNAARMTQTIRQAVKQISNSMQNIEGNSEIIKYNSSITAQNTELLKWIEILR